MLHFLAVKTEIIRSQTVKHEYNMNRLFSLSSLGWFMELIRGCEI